MSTSLMPRAGPRRFIALSLLLGYPLILLASMLSLRFIGERWWLTTLALYLPRWGYAIPLPFVIAGLVATGKKRLWAIETLAVLALLLPFMGLHLSLSREPTKAGPTLRVLSYNVHSGAGGNDRLLEEIEGYRPDLVLVQETTPAQLRYFEKRMPDRTVRAASQFLIASRFPIVDTVVPPPYEGAKHPPAHARYTIETPLGVLDFISIHPISPHEPMNAIKGDGIRQGIESGRLFSTTAAPLVDANTALRMRQLQDIVAESERATHPVILAGDTNLPDGSWALARYLSRFQDAFLERGAGFGYTFPTNKMVWMRLDRILGGPEINFVHFEVGKSNASDHRCVVADLRLR